MNFLIVDLESTNKNPSSCEIIELAWIYANDKLEVIEEAVIRFNAMLWDKEAIEASQIHGIKKEDLKGLDFFDAGWFNTVLERFNECHFVCHSHRKIFGKFTTYDYTALKVNLFPNHWDLYKTCPTEKIISTHSLAKHLNISGKLDLKSLAQYFNLKEFNHHSAMDDTKTCYELLKIMLPKVDLNQFLDSEKGLLNERSSDEHEITTTKPKKRRNGRK